MAYKSRFTLICDDCEDQLHCYDLVVTVAQAREYAHDSHDWFYDEKDDRDICRACVVTMWKNYAG